MISLYSIYHGQSVAEDKRVIDSNDKILAHIQAYEEKIRLQRQERRKQLADEFFENLSVDEEGKPVLTYDEEGNPVFPVDDLGEPVIYMDEEGNLSDEPFELPYDDNGMESDEAEEGASSEELAAQILEDARMQADQILGEASMQAQALKSNAKEEGRQEGYRDGIAQAEGDYQEKLEQLEMRKNQLEQEYHAKMQSVEQDLLEVVCDVVGKAFHVSFSDDQDMILHLVDNALSNIENAREFLIRVNEKNFIRLNQEMDRLQEKVGSGISLDLVKDPLLTDEKCMIETDGGVYDCSFDTELNNLIKDLKMLGLS
ncbi:Flagellar assembly protein FliH [Lachnospiraceae bacterium C10]|jgi:flagellar assembly protein FliH|nr:Flagellar assembly protein FliH [Lachnospiraceae bacterium C10]SDW00485.1 Flagellar biosynthesis/type III secretory pathway protein FliH [Lachnospiraceae bacterium KHCPX20]